MVSTARRAPRIDMGKIRTSRRGLTSVSTPDEDHRDPDVVARLRELDELKTTFLGAVSHELRTTVTIIEGFSMLLARQWSELDDAQRTDFVERIWTNSRSLGVLVEDLLDLARLDKAGSPVVPEEVDLIELVPKIVAQMSVTLAPHPITLTAEGSAIACVDPMAIERVLVNLLSNASSHTDPATPIHVDLSVEGTQVVLRVADSGPGIPLDERERVFERFYRGSGACDRAARGLGIGLPIVRDLVTHLGGTVTLVETPGGGATFEVSLPSASAAVA